MVWNAITIPGRSELKNVSTLDPESDPEVFQVTVIGQSKHTTIHTICLHWTDNIRAKMHGFQKSAQFSAGQLLELCI
jgi:hypothetical protein